jgi:hypothetical protein
MVVNQLLQVHESEHVEEHNGNGIAKALIDARLAAQSFRDAVRDASDRARLLLKVIS